jgi:opacity protein-like surface antigen
MSKTIRLIGAALLLFAFTAAAQDKSTQMETFLGYSLTRFNSERNIPAFSANGGSGQFVYNFGDSFGAVLDLGAVHNGNIHNVHLDTTVADFLLGPRFAMHKWSRFTPYVQALFGGAYGTTSLGVSPDLLVHPAPLTTVIPPGDFLRAVKNDTCFAMTAGGGLDIKFSKHVAFRPIQLEYFLTKFHNPLLNNRLNQNNLRYSAGVNFTFGRAL